MIVILSKIPQFVVSFLALSFVACSGPEIIDVPSFPEVTPVSNPTFISASPTVIRPSTISLSKDSWGHRAGPRGFDTVVIDAGHGGKDPGASVSGVQEKKLALDTALRLKRLLQRDFKVILLRSSDRFISLDKRASMGGSRSGSVFLSLHYNYGPSWVRGPETYYWRVDSHGLASRIQKNMERVSPREYQNAGLTRRRLRLTRNVKVPSVLVEIGYLSNSSERRYLASSGYREKMANAIASAVREQARVGDAGTGAKPKALWSSLSRKGDKAKL